AMDETVDEIGDLLRTRHKVAQDDFTVQSQQDFLNTFNQIAGTFTLLLGAIAGISLVVGGIGIMNIMLVSVTERTREIGLRMAVGARGKDILRQFLVEAIVLCLLGGVIGILFGRGCSLLIEVLLHWPIATSVPAILGALFVSATVGIVFGYYPAWKASRLDPIDALRYE
ncbi:MAG TPA: FtsX-like permease family protein, partial [Tepidisphaeraceae bacterium]|nr:FtsX-like permease family protein [Tepidisphaeraceae bacterium]